jgi:flagellar basal-body rod modification protein FlgD
MVVDPLANAAPPSSANNSTADKASKKSAMDYDTFLKLLVAQMKNQDPTEPMKATEQIAQLATFSQVEQTIMTNKRLESILVSSNLTQAGSIIGRTLTNADGTISGVVEKVKVLAEGLTAVLTNGTEVPVTSGVTLK